MIVIERFAKETIQIAQLGTTATTQHTLPIKEELTFVEVPPNEIQTNPGATVISYEASQLATLPGEGNKKFKLVSAVNPLANVFTATPYNSTISSQYELITESEYDDLVQDREIKRNIITQAVING